MLFGLETAKQTMAPADKPRGVKTIEINQVRSAYNKYESIIDRSFRKSSKGFLKDFEFAQMAADYTGKYLSGVNHHHSRNRLGSTRKTIYTWDGSMWTGRIYVGSKNDPMDVIFDNASDWLSIEGSACTANCEGSVFEVEKSTTA